MIEISDEWERLPGTDAGAYYGIGADVVLAVPIASFVQSEASALRSMAAFDAIAQLRGRKQALLVAVDRLGSQDSGARRVWARARARETRAVQALLCSTMLARAIGSFFLGLNKAAIPTKMFAELSSARAWAERMVEAHGGPLD